MLQSVVILCGVCIRWSHILGEMSISVYSIFLWNLTVLSLFTFLRLGLLCVTFLFYFLHSNEGRVCLTFFLCKLQLVCPLCHLTQTNFSFPSFPFIAFPLVSPLLSPYLLRLLSFSLLPSCLVLSIIYWLLSFSTMLSWLHDYQPAVLFLFIYNTSTHPHTHAHTYTYIHTHRYKILLIWQCTHH